MLEISCSQAQTSLARRVGLIKADDVIGEIETPAVHLISVIENLARRICVTGVAFPGILE